MTKSLIHPNRAGQAIALRARAPRAQRGMVLLEALIAVVLFAFGVLGLLSLQANATKESTDAKYRSDASLLANELLGKMWISDRTAATLNANFSSYTGAEYVRWLGAPGVPGTVLGTLPQSPTTPQPVVLIGQIAAGGTDPTALPSNSVSITMYWRAPYESTDHAYNVVARIR